MGNIMLSLLVLVTENLLSTICRCDSRALLRIFHGPSLRSQALAYLADASDHRRNFVKLECGALRNSQILTVTDLNHVLTNILLPETQQHKLTKPFLQREAVLPQAFLQKLLDSQIIH